MSEGRGLDGHLELVCDVDGRGWTRLRHQSFRAPFHLSKPHHDAGALVLNVVNPTAGLLEGDRLRTEVSVEAGARLVLTTPSANRVHAMRGGKAESSQTFRVASGGSLEVWPEVLIPQRGARYTQRTVVELARGAVFLFFETLAPGRVASGEIFVFEELRWMTDVRLDGRLVARERYCLNPAGSSLHALQRVFPRGYYASGILISPVLEADANAWEALRALHVDGVWLGLSSLEKNVYILRLVAPDSLAFRRTLHLVRGLVYEGLGRPLPGLRRTGDPHM